MENIAENIKKIQHLINKLPVNSKTKIIAVTKGFDEKTVKKAINLGLSSFGENRVIECEQKFNEITKIYPHIDLHMIGPLQTNKVKKSLKLFNSIHSLDRESLALELKKHLSEKSLTKNFFIQVNTGYEKQKSGILPNNTNEFIKWCNEDLGLNIVGLMCIPPISEDSETHFNILKELAKKNNLKNLSMGMSQDFEKAIVCGATHVRLGTVLFGERTK